MLHGVSRHTQGRALKPKLKPSIPITRPVNETKKPPATISTSAILRKKPMKEVYGKKYSRRHQPRESQHELFLDYQDQVENSRLSLLNTSHVALRQTHSTLTTALSALQMHDAASRADLDAQRHALLAPISDETVETHFTRDGKSVKETLQIGQRVQAFKTLLAAKEAELVLYWAEWERVQAKIVRLGVEVLGPEAFEGGGGVAGDDVRGEGGYRREMEELELEYQVWLEEIEEEIRLIGEESIEKMRATEKELDANLKKEQASLIAQVFANGD